MLLLIGVMAPCSHGLNILFVFLHGKEELLSPDLVVCGSSMIKRNFPSNQLLCNIFCFDLGKSMYVTTILHDLSHNKWQCS